MSTTAITTNSATSVSLGKAIATAADLDRAERDAHRLGEADQERGDEGPRDRAQPADHGDDERFRDDREIHAQIGRLPRQLQRSREPREKGAEREHRGEQRPLVDAQRAGERAILGRGARQHAEPGALQQRPECQQHERADGEQEQVVGGNQLAENGHRAAQSGCARPEQILGAPGEERGIAHDQHDAEGGGELQQLGRGVDALQQQRLDQHADERDRERGQQDGAPEAERPSAEGRDERVRDVRTQHVQRAVREVDHPRDPEDQRESRRDQEQRGRAGKAVQELREEGGEGHAEGTLMPAVRGRRMRSILVY